MRVLLTRPAEASRLMRERLETLGLEVMEAPMLSIHVQTGVRLNLEGVQGLIATSRNGLIALRDCPDFEQARALPLYAVGPGTAEAAREMGFATLVTGPGGAQALTDLIASRADPAGGSLLHLAGDRLAFDTEGALEQKGFTVRKELLYRTLDAERLPSEVAEAIRAQKLDAVLLMSPRSATVFSSLVREADLAEPVRHLAFLCLSEGVALSVSALNPVNLSIARAPNMEEMLALVTLLAAKFA